MTAHTPHIPPTDLFIYRGIHISLEMTEFLNVNFIPFLNNLQYWRNVTYLLWEEFQLMKCQSFKRTDMFLMTPASQTIFKPFTSTSWNVSLQITHSSYFNI